MRRPRLVLLALSLGLAAAGMRAAVFDGKSFGAQGDGRTFDTAAGRASTEHVERGNPSKPHPLTEWKHKTP